MSKKTISNEQLIRVKAKYEAKFGISLDMWSAMNLAMIEESFESLESKVEQANGTIISASEKIKAEVKQYHFKNKWEAFYFNLGLFLVPSLSFFGISFLIYSLVSINQEFKEQRRFLEDHDKTFDYRYIIQFGKVVIKGKNKYLVLKNIPLTKPSFVFGKEACYMKNENLIYVPLKPEK